MTNVISPVSNPAFTKITPDNNSKISPLTGKVLYSDRRQPVQVTFSPSSTEDLLSGINNADLIFEYINEDGKLAYNAIFHDNIPYNIKPITNIQDISLNNLPKFTFSQTINRLYADKKKASYIFVTMSYNIFSNFIYENGSYFHYKDNKADIDSSNDNPVSISNIIIQYTDNSEGIKNINSKGNGSGLLFSGGRVVEIQWKNDGTRPIEIIDEENNPVILMEGKTWCVVLNKNCHVAFN